MSNLSRLVLAYIVAIPLALVLGYLVATPDTASVAALGFVLICLALPLFIQWNHALLIISWNSAFVVGFAPGQPQLWLVLAASSFGIALLNYVLGFKSFIRVPELLKPLVFLLVIILVTAWVRGGIGLKILGGSGYGGKKYIYLLGAFMGYFALTAQRISIGKSQRTVKWFFLSALSFAMGNLIYALGPAFYVLYYFISPDSVGSQVAADWGQNVIERFGGLGPAASGLLAFILTRWGIRRMFEWNKPWRWLLLIAVMVAGLFSGYRSLVGFLFALFFIQFLIEGLWKTHLLPAMILLAMLVLAPALFFANKMPRAVQRSLAFLPLDINADVRADTDASSEWRFQIWRLVWPEVPKYLLLGKGYALDPVELDMTTLAARTGAISNYEEALYAGDYHNGLLSVLVPFGLLGLVAFFWLLGAGIKVLYCNHRFGDARLKQVNGVLLSYFLTQCVFFFFVFGALNVQLVAFLGILGISVSLNNGVCRKEAPKAVPTTAVSGLVMATTG